MLPIGSKPLYLLPQVATAEIAFTGNHLSISKHFLFIRELSGNILHIGVELHLDF